MSDPGVILTRAILALWRAGHNSAEIAATIALSEQNVLHVIWAERAARQRILLRLPG